LSNLDI